MIINLIMQVIQWVFQLSSHLVSLSIQHGPWIYGFLFAIIFCETGLVIASFLPGDSLLFAAGAVAAKGILSLPFLMISLIMAAFLGNTMNYWIGRLMGDYLLSRRRGFKINQSSFDKTRDFYAEQGGRAIILALFIPIIRSFVPFVAGFGKMAQVSFLLYNGISAFIWVMSILGISYLFGNTPVVQNHFSFVIIAIIFISILPILIKLGREYCCCRVQIIQKQKK